MKVLELFAGIGGVAAAKPAQMQIVGAVDASLHVLQTYAKNWSHPTFQQNIEGISPAFLEKLEADCWWLSPPCQPHTVRGNQHDVDDPRSASFLRSLELISALKPTAIGFENVEGFKGSRAHELLLECLAPDYTWHETILCPSEFGVPNRRPRFLLAAHRGFEPKIQAGDAVKTPLKDYLLPPTPELYLTEHVREKFGQSMHVVDADDPDALTAVFTSAYTKTWMFAGSFLREADSRLRAFSPHEILGLLGFPANFDLSGLGRRQAYKYIGQSLSVPTTRAVLEALISDRS